MSPRRKVFYLKTPVKMVHVYRVVARSKEEALEIVGTDGEQLSSEGETDTGPTVVIEVNEECES